MVKASSDGSAAHDLDDIDPEDFEAARRLVARVDKWMKESAEEIESLDAGEEFGVHAEWAGELAIVLRKRRIYFGERRGMTSGDGRSIVVIVRRKLR